MVFHTEAPVATMKTQTESFRSSKPSRTPWWMPTWFTPLTGVDVKSYALAWLDWVPLPTGLAVGCMQSLV